MHRNKSLQSKKDTTRLADLKRAESNKSKEFNEYFLNAQKEGNEVYIGKGVAMVVYDEGKICIHSADDFLNSSPVLLTEDLPDNWMKEDWMKDIQNILKEIRKPQNMNGINENLTKPLMDLYLDITIIEEEDASMWVGAIVGKEEKATSHSEIRKRQLSFNFDS